MSAELIKQLLDAGRDSGAEVVGGTVIATIDGKNVRLGGPEGESNTFGLTEEGRAVLSAVKPKKSKRTVAEITEEIKADEDELQLDA